MAMILAVIPADFHPRLQLAKLRVWGFGDANPQPLGQGKAVDVGQNLGRMPNVSTILNSLNPLRFRGTAGMDVDTVDDINPALL